MTRLQRDVLATLAALTIYASPERRVRPRFSAIDVADLQGCRVNTATATLENLASEVYAERYERGPVFPWDHGKTIQSYAITAAGLRAVLLDRW